MDATLLRELEAAAQRYGLPLPLLVALAKVESAGDIYAWRAEPAYRYLVDVSTGKPFHRLTAIENASEAAPRDFAHFPHSSRDTEWWGQQCSWGPLQVMGAVAREYGFRGPFPQLCTASFGAQYGAQHLHNLRRRFLALHGWEGVAAAYNAGSPRRQLDGQWGNQAYVGKVRAAGGFDFNQEEHTR
jgi:hypothetical protein